MIANNSIGWSIYLVEDEGGKTHAILSSPEEKRYDIGLLNKMGDKKVFHKYITKKNFYCNYNGWTISAMVLDLLKDDDIVIYSEKNKHHITTAKKFRAHGVIIRNDEYQVALAEEFWSNRLLPGV
jgi:hypothetical protein